MTEPPNPIREVLARIARDRTMNNGLKAMTDRASEFSSPLAARLTGVALNERARHLYDDALDKMWANATIPRKVDEVVVGGGLHAAIYCAARVHAGHPKPLVIEARERVGGVFATSREATFYLNSRNRPGGLGIPGRGEALNYLPGAVVQPADLSGEEYQTNLSLAFSIRATLAAYAKVVSDTKVVVANDGGVLVNGRAGTRRIKAKRVIFATGLGKPRMPIAGDRRHLVDYLEFLASLDQPFPLRGVESVAVIGAGDSGKTVIEALVGQGPASNWSVAALDYVKKIDWYGVPPSCTNRFGWEREARSRYKGIGRVLPKEGQSGQRVNPIPARADQVAFGYEGAYVDGARYDLAVWAAGFAAREKAEEMESLELFEVGNRAVARQGDGGVFVVGPAARLPEVDERNLEGVTGIPENSVAVFRYADRTAGLAMALPAPPEPKRATRKLKTRRNRKTSAPPPEVPITRPVRADKLKPNTRVGSRITFKDVPVGAFLSGPGGGQVGQKVDGTRWKVEGGSPEPVEWIYGEEPPLYVGLQAQAKAPSQPEVPTTRPVRPSQLMRNRSKTTFAEVPVGTFITGPGGKAVGQKIGDRRWSLENDDGDGRPWSYVPERLPLYVGLKDEAKLKPDEVLVK